MSISWYEARKAWLWQFKATVAGERHRLSKLLPRGWSEAQARKFDQAETARTYARLSAGPVVKAPLIEQAVACYVRERVPALEDGQNSARNLAHLVPFFAGRPLNDLGAVSREIIEANESAPPEDKLAAGTVAQRLRTLRAAANYALKHHRLGTKDWIAQMVVPTPDNSRHLYMTRAEVLRLARACPHLPTRAWILVTFATGARPGEVHRAERVGDSQLLMPRTKNGQRIILPIHPRVRRYLRHWPLELDYTRYSAYFREAREAVGRPEFHPHDLRHSTASALASSGASLFQVGRVLGHKSMQATDRYAHLYAEEKARILEGLW